MIKGASSCIKASATDDGDVPAKTHTSTTLRKGLCFLDVGVMVWSEVECGKIECRRRNITSGRGWERAGVRPARCEKCGLGKLVEG